jgi:UDP-2,3-diacylglucosamine pyrophosphatase LpxH
VTRNRRKAHRRDDSITRSLSSLFDGAVRLDPADHPRIVILSDLHIGNRGRGDDFLKNADLCIAALKDFYLPQGYTLILNGDIEELHRYTLKEVTTAWPEIYEIFGSFGAAGKLYKTIGNHDILLPLHRDYNLLSYMCESLRIEFGEDTLFVFHGHQASKFQARFNMMAGILLRLVARPLGIKSYSVSADKKKQFRVEQRAYDFSSRRRIASIVGHTHRPLFESMSKSDALRYKIEGFSREYAAADIEKRGPLGAKILELKAELDARYENGEPGRRHPGIYNSKILVPSLFNSGCGIGKRGITGIEIGDGTISLVHWFDRQRGSHHLTDGSAAVKHLDGTDYYRVTLDKELLSYICTRIRLLSDG